MVTVAALGLMSLAPALKALVMRVTVKFFITFDLSILENGDEDSFGSFAVGENEVATEGSIVSAGSGGAIGSEIGDGVGADDRAIGADHREEDIGAGLGDAINGIGEERNRPW